MLREYAKLRISYLAFRNGYMEPNNLTTFSQLYLSWSQCNKKSFRNDAIAMKHLLDFFGDCKLSALSKLRAEQYRQKRRDEILARPKYKDRDPRSIPLTTVNREIACLRHMMTLAVEWKLLSANPLLGIRMFQETPRDRVLSQDEYHRLLAHSAPLTRNLIVWASNTGMRVSEITGLTWPDIDLPKRSAVLSNTKNGNVRHVPLNTAALNVLRLQSRQAQGEYIFHFRGRRIKRIDNGFEHACRRSGITNLRFHDLRHCFATALSEAGCNLVALRDILGHSSMSMVARYSHPGREYQAQVVERIVR